jgi:hypothetical protein
MTENTDLKKRIKDLEEKNVQLAGIAKETGLNFDKVKMPNPADIMEATQLKSVENFLLN